MCRQPPPEACCKNDLEMSLVNKFFFWKQWRLSLSVKFIETIASVQRMVEDCESTLRESRWREQGVKQWAEWKTSAPAVNWAITDFYFVSIFSITPLQEKITAEFNWLRLIDLLWLLSGDMNLSIAVLVDFFGSKRTAILSVCCLSLDNKINESKLFQINSVCRVVVSQ